MESVTPVDLVVMSINLDKLEQPIKHFLDKISMEIRNLTNIANYSVLETLDGLYQKHQTRNDTLYKFIKDAQTA
ncbi:hypothetical protein BEWA_036870 [Theileria equi strain WA]|uniref:Uncharacterized protein n=1 Tax=Theileria equi strain WA TaxID=1537102 RepID=L1LE78_THEEQ|nr:hypothetical protein BEWA_036870 [Theileria equi strain WA]EKX73651.1 hypothetical protein BEWA_036870 [Theileria equi strain WA]|eukprot:XP_004833103.1 hypothetical protein BEWA_036870 [Theileria equi strain WA]